MCFVGITTVTAGVLSIRDIFWPLTARPGQRITGYLDSALMALFIVGVVLVLAGAVRRWIGAVRGEPVPPESFGAPRAPDGGIPMRCC